MATEFNVDHAVRSRYSQAAQQREPSLCCPVDYDARYLEIIPSEVIERDYGCGDPSKYVAKGETVLDLGSGSGKICFIASQVVGESGSVIGVDCNDEMLSLARTHAPTVAERTGFANVDFRKGKIQDLQLNLELLDEFLHEHPVQNSSDWLLLEEQAERLRQDAPLVADDSVDVVVSNCVLNLVTMKDRQQLFAELLRVLKRGGRAVISDIVSDETVPEHLQRNDELWSGCMSGAFREDEFLKAFEDAGFYGIEIVARQEQPWAVVEGIEFRSMTIRAYKGKDGPCLERNQAVVYHGPWKTVTDDDGHKLIRGQRMAVCDKTYQIYTREPYASQITAVPPEVELSLENAAQFDCSRTQIRSPKQTKQSQKPLTILPAENCCEPNGDCC